MDFVFIANVSIIVNIVIAILFFHLYLKVRKTELRSSDKSSSKAFLYLAITAIYMVVSPLVGFIANLINISNLSSGENGNSYLFIVHIAQTALYLVLSCATVFYFHRSLKSKIDDV